MTRLYRQPHPQRELFSSDRFFLAACRNQTFQRGLCMIDYESYRGDIEKVIEDYRVAHGGKKTAQLGAAGRYAIDPVFIFKCIVTQRALGLADDAMHDQMLCDARVREHLGINRPEDVPSAKTLWKYKNIFAQTDLMTIIFADHINPELADLFYAYGILDSDRFIGESSYLVWLRSNQTSFYLGA